MMAEKSDLAVYEAVKGMLPKNSLGRQMLTKLRVYKGAEHNHQAQQPKTLIYNEKKPRRKMICTPKVGQTFGGAYFYVKRKEI